MTHALIWRPQVVIDGVVVHRCCAEVHNHSCRRPPQLGLIGAIRVDAG